ncbi:MAG TPA: hypothetical protein VFT55_08260, partial [Planctomycetota bacterium]|nr:hypothetical protein [Planctomycetota bacterium]
MDRALLPFLPLSLAAFAAALPAQKQIAESVEAIQKRVQALLAEYVPMAEAQLTRKGPASP